MHLDTTLSLLFLRIPKPGRAEPGEPRQAQRVAPMQISCAPGRRGTLQPQGSGARHALTAGVQDRKRRAAPQTGLNPPTPILHNYVSLCLHKKLRGRYTGCLHWLLSSSGAWLSPGQSSVVVEKPFVGGVSQGPLPHSVCTRWARGRRRGGGESFLSLSVRRHVAY